MKPVVREHIQQLDVSLGGGLSARNTGRYHRQSDPYHWTWRDGDRCAAALKYQINRRFKARRIRCPRREWTSRIMWSFWLLRPTNRIRINAIKASGLIRSMNSCFSQCRDWRPPPEPQHPGAVHYRLAVARAEHYRWYERGRRTPSGPFAPVHEDYASGAGDRQEDQDAVGRHEQKADGFPADGTVRRYGQRLLLGHRLYRPRHYRTRPRLCRH